MIEMTNYYQALGRSLPQSTNIIETMIKESEKIVKLALDEPLTPAFMLREDRAVIIQALRTPQSRGRFCQEINNLLKDIIGPDLTQRQIILAMTQAGRIAIEKPGRKVLLSKKKLALILVALQCNQPDYDIHQFIQRKEKANG